MDVYTASVDQGVAVRDMLRPEVMTEIAVVPQLAAAPSRRREVVLVCVCCVPIYSYMLLRRRSFHVLALSLGARWGLRWK